jgi:hypothetical protein
VTRFKKNIAPSILTKSSKFHTKSAVSYLITISPKPPHKPFPLVLLVFTCVRRVHLCVCVRVSERRFLMKKLLSYVFFFLSYKQNTHRWPRCPGRLSFMKTFTATAQKLKPTHSSINSPVSHKMYHRLDL